MYSAPHPPTAGNANLRLARCRDGVCPRSSHSGTQPPTQHSAFFSTTYAVPILRVLLFDIHPSNGEGVYPHCCLYASLQTPLTVRRADFTRRRPRNQVQGQHHAIRVLLPDQISFPPRQRPALDAYPGSNAQIRMRFDPRPVQNSLAKAFDFPLRQWIRLPVKPHQPHNARNFQNSQARTHRNTYKYVPRKEWQVELHAQVLPAPHRSVKRKEMLDIPCFKVLYYPLLMIRARISGKPAPSPIISTATRHCPGN